MHEHADRRAILTGWVAAYCQRVKRFPTLQTLLKKQPRRQTLEEQCQLMDRLMVAQNARKR